jgi:NTE family protein
VNPKRPCSRAAAALRTVLLGTLLFQLMLWSPVGQAEVQRDGAKRPKIGLVLGGGGARGAAHIGVLKVLEQLRVPIDVVAGTSMGSIVGGLYASGLSADEIEGVLNSIDWDDAFKDRTPREDRPFIRKRDDDLYLVQRDLGVGDDGKVKFPAGLVEGQKIDLILKKATLHVDAIDDFDDLPTPFRAIATDVVTGKAAVLGHGDLARAIRASMSVPAIFAPVEIEGKLLVDGGIASNVPVSVARSMGADIVIVIDVGSPALKREELTTVIDIANQLTWMLTARNTEAELATLKPNDVFMRPELGDFSAANFAQARTVIPIGEKAAGEKRARLAKLGVSEQAFQRHLAARESRAGGTPIVEFVRLDNQSKLSDEVIEARLHTRVGVPLDTAALDRDIGDIYGLGNFESVRYEIVKENGRTGVLVKAKEKSWGPNFLQFGLQLSQTDSGDSTFNIGAQYRRPAINSLNGEVQVAAQIGSEPAIRLKLYQPLDDASRWFVEPEIGLEQLNFDLYDDGDRIARYRVSRVAGALAGGRNFGNWGELRAGVVRASGDAELRIGGPSLEGYEFDEGFAFVRFATDTLDNVYFPRDGYATGIKWTSSLNALGADVEYDQLEASGLYAHSWDRDTLALGLNLATTVNGDAPIEALYRLGGFLRLSGLNDNSIAGQSSALARAVYMRRINDIQLLPAYLGASLEAGNVWQDRDDFGKDLIVAGSVFLGLDSPIGPFYIGGGVTDAGELSGFLLLGRALRN